MENKTTPAPVSAKQVQEVIDLIVEKIVNALQVDGCALTNHSLKIIKKVLEEWQAAQLQSAPKVLNNPTIEEIKNKYKKYISNIDWDTKTNERKGKAKELNDEQIKYYEEFLSDLRTLQSIQSAPKQSDGEFELKIQEMQSLIEKQMEQWDREKKIKAAQAIEDLQKFIITT